MNERELIVQYRQTKKILSQLKLELKNHFVSLAKKAIKNDDLDSAISAMENCPDESTKDFIAELINELPSKNGFYG